MADLEEETKSAEQTTKVIGITDPAPPSAAASSAASSSAEPATTKKFIPKKKVPTLLPEKPVVKEGEEAEAAAEGTEGGNLADYIRQEPPYTAERMNQIATFYKKRERFPSRYKYNPAGNLIIHSKSGSLEETIPLKSYIAYDTTMRETRDQNRLDAIGQAETKYEEANAALQKAREDYKVSGAKQPVLAAQIACAEADAVLSKIRYGTRGIQTIPNPETRSVLFDQPYEVRKLFPQTADPFKKQVARLIVLEQPYRSFYGFYTDSKEEPTEDIDKSLNTVPKASELSTRQRLKDGRWARIFFESDEGANGFLSPFWPVEYTMGDTRYMTALQAFEVQRAKEAGQQTIVDALLKTRSPRTMRFLTKKLETQPKNPKELWLNIFTSIYQQTPELKARLMETGTDALVFADIRKGPSGVGLGELDAGILDPAKWTGENAVGSALETLRYRFREGTAAEAAVATTVANRVITEEEQQKAKVGAIMAAKKFTPARRAGV